MDIQKLLTDFVTSQARNVVMMARGFITIPIMTKLLGADAYGVWASVIGLVTIISGVGSFDFSSALIRYTPEEDKKGQTFVDLTILTSATAVIIAGVFIAVDVIVGILPEWGDSSNLLIATVALVLAYSVQNTVRNYPKAKNRVKLYEGIHTGQTVLEIIAVIVAILLTKSIIAVFWALFMVSVLVNGGIVVLVFKKRLVQPDPSNFKEYVQFCFPMVTQTLMGRLIRNADKYMLLIMVSPTVAGVYAVSSSIGKMTENIAQALNPTLYPAVVRAWEEDEYDSLSNIYGAIIRWFVIFGVPAIIGLAILARPLLTTVSTGVIAEQGQYLLPVLGFGFVISALNSPLVFIVQAAEQTERLMGIYTVAAVVNLAFNVVTIPQYGSLGAATATILSYSLITVYLFYWTRKKIRFTLPLVTVPKALFGAALMGGFLFAAPSFSRPVRVVVYPLLGITVYIPIMVLTGAIRKEELLTAKAVVQSARK